ncbi:hypothetical protein [Vibrio phage phiKT1024]|nr:hypothetical protein [Vibrio phage phiKT1024]
MDLSKYDNIEDIYPFLVNDIMKYIEVTKSNDRYISLMDIMLDYSMKKDISVEVIGDAIASDEYFKSFIEKDCEMHRIILSEKQEEW